MTYGILWLLGHAFASLFQLSTYVFAMCCVCHVRVCQNKNQRRQFSIFIVFHKFFTWNNFSAGSSSDNAQLFASLKTTINISRNCSKRSRRLRCENESGRVAFYKCKTRPTAGQFPPLRARGAAILTKYNKKTMNKTTSSTHDNYRKGHSEEIVFGGRFYKVAVFKVFFTSNVNRLAEDNTF